MIPVGEQEDIAFQPDRGFALDEIKSTCEGDAISNGFRVRATADPCLLEASFSANATPPSTPIIVATDFWDGEIGLLVSVGDDGGIDITGYEATCTDGTNTYTGTSTTSPVTVSGLTNGVAYTCTVTATNSVGQAQPLRRRLRSPQRKQLLAYPSGFCIRLLSSVVIRRLDLDHHWRQVDMFNLFSNRGFP